MAVIRNAPITRQLALSYNGRLSHPDWGCYSLAEVRIQDGESIENALRRFKRKVQQEDIIKEVKKHSFYLKPGERKRIKQAMARKRSRKKVRRVPED
jgi:small subunit ribosomal protein S21